MKDQIVTGKNSSNHYWMIEPDTEGLHFDGPDLTSQIMMVSVII